MQKVFSWDERKRDDSGRRIIMKESTRSTGTDDNVFSERKQTYSKGEEEDSDDVREDDEEEDDQGNEKTVEGPGGQIDSPKADMRIESCEGDSFDDDDDDDDRRSSACSEAINREGDFSGLPPDDLLLLLPAKYSTLDRNFKLQSKAESLVEALEKQRRQTVGNRLKDLQTTTKTRPVTSNSSATIGQMPIIARRSPSKGAVLLLPKQTTRRRGGNYESVLVSPLFFSSRSKPSASPGRSPERSGRIHSATGGKGDTGDLRRMEHRSNSPRCYLPRGDGDTGYSDGPSPENAMLRGAAAATATATAAAAAAVRSLNSQMKIAGNKNDDDASPKQRTGRQGRVANGNERKQFFSGKVEKEESVRKTDWSKETEEERERASSVTSLLRLPSSPSNGDISFGRIASISPSPSTGDPEMSHSKRHSSDNRTCSWSSASRETDDSLRRPDVNTTETSRCISKIRDNLTDTVPTDNNRPTALRSNTDAPLNKDESKYKAFGGRGDVVIPKTNSSFTVETKNYYSDIRIKLKEAEPIFPFSLRSPEVTQMPNGEAPGVSSSSSKEREEDDDESEIPENVTPNWSSYPGPLLNASTAHESEDEEAIGVIGRNTSAIEADVNCADDNADTDADIKATYNELLSADCSVREISTPSTKAGDCQTNKTKTKDSDPERCSYVHLNSAAAAERSAGSDKQLQTSDIFVSNNYKPTNTNKTSNHKSARDDPRRSTERSEAYVIESHSANRRTLTRDSRSSSVSNSPTGRSSDAGSRTERSFAAQNNEPALAAARRTQDSSTGGAVNRLFTRQENAGAAADRPKRQSSDAIRDGASASANLRWESSATRINDQKTGERFRSSSSSRSPEKTASIERIWQSIEEPRPRLLRRKIRFEPEPVSPSSTSTTVKSSSSSRRCRVSSYDGGVADDVDATPVENGIHRKNTRLEDKTEDEYSLLEIEVPKGGIGLGFCIDGGKDGPYGDRPITVKRLFRGSSDPTPSAANANLCPGDEILSANGRNMTLLSRYVAWNYLKTLPEGTIKLVVRRQH